jgi:CDP-diglyceride synthetase
MNVYRTLLALLLLVVSWTAAAETVSVGWSPVADSRVKTYQVHYGTTLPGVYTLSKSVTTTTATSTGIDPAVTTYFAVRACDAVGSFCSLFSNEIKKDPTPLPAPPENFRILLMVVAPSG